ncbi:hypothetical protein M8818_003090 [Zalaria obscura]|uniref:Uncharacterized protein n=1 Tax=Zalaria obscura TaxID=2024903 RepID=A0ACC3SGB2_9PEZI
MGETHERTALLPPRDPDTKPPDETTAVLRRLSSAALPPFHEDYPSSEEPSSALAIWTVVPILLLGVFVANADGSLVIASSQKIASDFNALNSASWLVTSYVLAQCASQPLYGKLSDIFGRKANLTVSYTFFAAGCLLCGIGQAYWQVLAGRAISGIGGAGMTALVSIIIAGGPVGGWLTDTIGWRWSFYGQCPLTIAGLVLILWKIPNKSTKSDALEDEAPLSQKVKRVDMLGAVVLALTISAFLIALDFATKDAPWYHVLVPALLAILFAATFYSVERWWATEPILPIELITKRAASTSYLVAGFQIAAQFGLDIAGICSRWPCVRVDYPRTQTVSSSHLPERD